MSIIEQLQQVLEKAKTVQYPELELSLGQVGETFQPGVPFQHFDTLVNLIANSPSISSHTSHIITHIYNGLRSRHCVGQPPVFERKVNIEQFRFHCPERNIWIKVKLSAEIPEERISTKPTSVRLIQRQHAVVGDFVIDLSKTVSGKTKVKACNNDPTFEVELEVTNFNTTPEIILDKLSSLLGAYDENGERVQLSFE